MKDLWLLLSAFGIMFAVMSFAQECGIIAFYGGQKGVAAIISGVFLYLYVGRRA